MKKIWLIGVLLIIGIGIMIPFLRGPVEPSQNRTATIIILSQLESSLVAYKKDCQKFPTQDEGLAALIKPTESCAGKDMHWPYIRKVPFDGWGSPFEYLSDEKRIYVGTSNKSRSGSEIYFECEVDSNRCDEHF